MLVIDADTHIDEQKTPGSTCVRQSFSSSPRRAIRRSRFFPAFQPLLVNRWTAADSLYPRRREYVYHGGDAGTLDVPARLRAMDERGIHLQVLTTLFIMEATTRPEVSVALRRSYNRWLADRCAQSKGRLRWVCLPPAMAIDEAIKELKFGKDHGACGVLKKEIEKQADGPPTRTSFLFMKRPNVRTCRFAFIPVRELRTFPPPRM